MKYKLLIINGTVIHIGNILYDNILEARNKAEEIEKLTGMYTEVIADSEEVLDEIEIVHQENRELKEFISKQSDLINLYRDYIDTNKLEPISERSRIKRLEVELGYEDSIFVKGIKKYLEYLKELEGVIK